MSKLGCECGYIIIDQRDDLPYKAEFVADQDYEAFYGELVTFLVDLITARETGTQDKFITKHFTEIYPKNLPLSAIIGDVIAGSRLVLGHTMYECEQCGRIWLQTRPDENNYVAYFPETESRGVLRSHREDVKPGIDEH